MKNIIIAPDSFKGTLCAVQVCKTVSAALKEKYDDLTVKEIPIADGGEGTVDAYIHALGGEKIFLTVKSPLMRDIVAYYGKLSDDTAIIETAQASGITIEKRNNPIDASSYGTGELILHAVRNGAKRIFLGLGGSATTDCGVGLTRALGGKFFDVDEKETDAFDDVALIDLTAVSSTLKDVEIVGLCDVKNPLFGKNGAAYIFSAQKGATQTQIEFLDNRLKNIGKVTKELLNEDFSSYEGAGAAGGIGFAVLAFLDGKLRSGIDAMLDAVNFDDIAKNSDLIITGEGKMDNQSLMGKVPFGVAKRAFKKKVVAIVGINEVEPSDFQSHGISQVIETNFLHKPFSQVKDSAEYDLKIAAKKIEL